MNLGFLGRRGRLLLAVISMLFSSTLAYGDDITKNQSEDLNLLISQFVGGEANALLIMDLSSSMGVNFGGSNIGNWDSISNSASSTVLDCESVFCDGIGGCDGGDILGIPGHLLQRVLASHCAENTANTSVCGSKNCKNGVCEEAEEFNNQLACVLPLVGNTISLLNPIFTLVCGGPGSGSCVTPKERALAAALMEELGGISTDPNLSLGLGQCFKALNCNIGIGSGTLGFLTCYTAVNYNNFKACMANLQPITYTQTLLEGLLQPVPAHLRRSPACTGGTPNCRGVPQYGSSRVDVALDVIFDLLDADDSLNAKMCNDSNMLYNNASTSVSCRNYMETPFREVSAKVRGTGSGSDLPTTPAKPLINELTNSDSSVLKNRFRAMTFSGAHWAGCSANSTFQVAQGGFAGQSELKFQNTWKHFRGAGQAKGGSPLALALGFDDNNGNGNGGGNIVNDDALGIYRVELQSDPAISCRPEFVVVITDGDDTCSGDCGATPESCTGATSQLAGLLDLQLALCSTVLSPLLCAITPLPTLEPLLCSLLPTLCGKTLPPTTNANRRSSIQATSNLRTYYARNPVSNRGEVFKKEVLTFVISMGAKDAAAIRTANAMALAGGTHSAGVIQHTGPNGASVGTVDIDAILIGSGNSVYRNIGKALGIDTNASGAQLANCKTPSESGSCSFQSAAVFSNTYFASAGPLESTAKGESFAFFVNSAPELADALQTILGFIDTFTTSGISPTAPQSSTSVALRDRIFLSVLTPITDKRLWQGRMALYGFIDNPNNAGGKLVVDSTSSQNEIFNDDGSLNEFAKNFYWEVGKNLAERNLTSDPRRLFTVNRLADTDTTTNAGVVETIRHRGETTNFNLSNTALTPETFGISDADVTSPIPSYCAAGGITNCSTSCADVSSTACRTCVKGCIKNRVIDFMSGNTGIEPVGDPMGGPKSGGQSADSIGYNCFDAVAGTGSFANCSVRLGDIFHSVPVVVGSPSPLFFDEGFQNFAKAFKNRSAAIYVGANDGFMHSFHAGELVTNLSTANPFTKKQESIPFFNEGTGKELFGFAPPSFLPDSIAPTSPVNKSPDLPAGAISGITPPDYRFGDFKSFITDNSYERSFFDGSPLVLDVFIDGYLNGIANSAACTSAPALDGTIDPCGKEWHTILIAGYRNGGGAYTALDVSNVKCSDGSCSSIGKHKSAGADYPRHLWTTFDKHFGNTWSEPVAARVRMTAQDGGGASITTDRWVIFAGGGIDPTDTDPTNGVNFSNAFYAIDIATGKIIFKFHPSGSLANDDKMVCDMAAEPGVFDLNADGYADLVYIGDTCGRLWRFDVSQPVSGGSVASLGLKGNGSIQAPNWTGDIAFCANTTAECAKAFNRPTTARQPIFFAPTVTLDDIGRRHVIFSTGNRRNPTDLAQSGKLYNFIDGFIPSYLAGGSAVAASMKTEGSFASGQIIDIVPQTISGGTLEQFTVTGGSGIGNLGEFMVRFPNNGATNNPGGEKGFGTPIVLNRVLVFSTFAPPTDTAANPCSSGTGFGRVFALDYLTGQAALIRVPGSRDLLQGTNTQKSQAVGITVAEGMPTPAQLTFGARGSVVMTVAFTGSASAGGSQFLVWELPPLPARNQSLFWEEPLGS
ncbi:MAG: pilus assembly protein [Deltaproteobacteria bacterium]